MGQGASQQGIGNEVVEKTEETKLQCSIKTTVEESSGDGIDAAAIDAVEEKLKEVICRTVTNVPLAESGTKTENAGIKDRLDSPILQTCLGEEGKLLVKVIKVTGLCTKDKSGTSSPYCILSADQPFQRKRTSLIKDTDSPFWNEYFAFDVTSKTREITLNIFNFEKTLPGVNYHMDDNELSPEQDDFLGQAIVPLATVNRNQTCRLILPVLPKTNKCGYVKGELSLEFTFDKDGKVIDGCLPLVDVTDNKKHDTVAAEDPISTVKANETNEGTRRTSDTPSGTFPKSFPSAYSYSLDKSYMETSLDELAQEIEAYEAGPNPRPVVEEDKSVERLMEMTPVIIQPVEQVTEDISPAEVAEAVQEEPDTKPEEEAEKKEEQEETPEPKPKTKKSLSAKFKRRPKSTVEGQKKPEGEVDATRHSYHAGDKPDEDQETKDDNEEDKTEAAETAADDGAPAELTTHPRSKIRRSFNMKFKRGSKKDDKEKDKELSQETDTPKPDETDESKELEAVGESLQSDPPKSRFGRFKRSKDSKGKAEEKVEEKDEENVEENKDKEETKDEIQEAIKDESKEESKEASKEESKEDEAAAESPQSDQPKSKFARIKRSKKSKNEAKNEEEIPLETVDENVESSPSEKPQDQAKPKMRKFNLRRGKQRPMSMSAADTKPKQGSGDDEDRLDRNDKVRHSYHAGDLPEPSQLRKSTSESSLLSYSPNPYSSLVIEMTEKGEKKYYHIPVSMANRGTYEQKGVKYHVYNDHMFKATHFSSTTECAVCGNSIFAGKFGKQGYQCKDCKLATHKKCHYQTSDMCSSSSVKKIEILKAPTIVGN